MTAPTHYQGTLRPRITYGGTNEQGNNLFKIEWINEEDITQVVWTEEVKVPPDHSFVPQITGTGYFVPRGGMLIDDEGRRHFRINAEAGILGAVPCSPSLSKS